MKVEVRAVGLKARSPILRRVSDCVAPLLDSLTAVAIRPSIKAGDLKLDDIVAITPGEGWIAAFSSNENLPVIFWVFLRSGEVVGLVGDDPRGRVIRGELRAADKMMNFSNYVRG